MMCLVPNTLCAPQGDCYTMPVYTVVILLILTNIVCCLISYFMVPFSLVQDGGTPFPETGIKLPVPSFRL